MALAALVASAATMAMTLAFSPAADAQAAYLGDLLVAPTGARVVTSPTGQVVDDGVGNFLEQLWPEGDFDVMGRAIGVVERGARGLPDVEVPRFQNEPDRDRCVRVRSPRRRRCGVTASGAGCQNEGARGEQGRRGQSGAAEHGSPFRGASAAKVVGTRSTKGICGR